MALFTLKMVEMHSSTILMDNYKTAEKGEAVEFDLEESDRGLRAANIHKL